MNRYELLRYERGATIIDLSKATGVSGPTLRALEKTDEPRPSAPVAKALADFYGMTVADLLGLEPVEDAA